MPVSKLASFGAALGKALFVFALASALILSAVTIDAARNTSLPRPWTVLVLAAASYLASHLLRIARLALLNGDVSLSMRALAQVHLFTSGVSLAAPFKLGEVYRIVELSRLTGSASRGLILVWLERAFDVIVIITLLVIASAFQPSAVGSFLGVLGLSALFVVATLVLVVLMPDNLRRIGSYIIRRYDQEWTVGPLWLIAELRGMIGKMSQMLRGRHLSLLVFTVIIWALEGLSFGLVISQGRNLLQPVAGLLSFLSLTTEGQTLASLLQTHSDGSVPKAMVSYALVTQGALLLVASITGLGMVRHRLLATKSSKV